jgi:hypothetical protein
MPLVNFPSTDFDRLKGGDYLFEFDTNAGYQEFDRYFNSGVTPATDQSTTDPATIAGASQTWGLLRNSVLTLNDVSCAMKNYNTLLLPSEGLSLTFHVNIETASTPSERFIFRCGIGSDPTSGEPDHGAYFEYSDSINTAKWQCATANGGTRTKIDTGNNVSTGVFQSVGLKFLQQNSIVLFLINGIPVGNSSTNLPAGSQLMSLFTRLDKIVGSGSRRNVYTDFCYFTYKVTR